MTASRRLETDDLLDRLNAEPVLRVAAPPTEVRAAHRRAISLAITHGPVPAEHALSPLRT